MRNKDTFISILSVLSISLYPSFFLYFHNTGTATLQDFLGMASIFALLGLVIFGIFLIFFRGFGKAAFITNIALLFLLYFAYIEKLIVHFLPMLYYWHVALICLFLIAQLAIFIHKKVPTTKAQQFNQGFLLIFAGLILFNGVLAVPKYFQSMAVAKKTSGESARQHVSTQQLVEAQDLPNVYFFIFDEYAGYDSIKRYCDYDNIDFYNSLEKFGFVTSKHAMNETIDSFTEVPNLLQLQKVNSVEMAALDKNENLKDPYLLIFMKERGYSVNALDSTNYEFIDASYADTRLTSDFVSTYGTFQSYVIRNTAFYPFYGSQDHEKEISELASMFNYAIESSEKAESNLFTVGYFSFPHVPYIVDENGQKTNDADRLNLKDPDVYLGQYKYASKKILEMVNEIIKNDPGSIIILQSDHGYRLPSHLSSWYGINEYNLEEESPFERNILNAVYYQGKPIEIEGLNGLNTLKLVLNAILNANFEITQ